MRVEHPRIRIDATFYLLLRHINGGFCPNCHQKNEHADGCKLGEMDIQIRDAFERLGAHFTVGE